MTYIGFIFLFRIEHGCPLKNFKQSALHINSLLNKSYPPVEPGDSFCLQVLRRGLYASYRPRMTMPATTSAIMA